MTPPPLTVIVADRSEVDVFSSAVTVTVPSFKPEAGETVSHVAEPALTDQLVFEVMVKVFCSPEDEKLSDKGETVKYEASCVTLMVFVIPPPLTDMVVSRLFSDELLVAVTVIVPSLDPEGGEIDSHDEVLLTIQLVFEEIVNDFVSELFEKLNEDSERDREGEF